MIKNIVKIYLFNIYLSVIFGFLKEDSNSINFWHIAVEKDGLLENTVHKCLKQNLKKDLES